MNFSNYPESVSNSNYCDRTWSVTSENDTKIIIPSGALKEKEPPKFPVFFNPAAKFNRDVSIQIYKTFIDFKNDKESFFVDTMAGSGIRGLRVANEIPKITKIIFNDFNHFSIQVCKTNAVLNGVYAKCEFYNKEICNFLSSKISYENRATIVDIDPFGTPAPYLDCVLRSVENGGLISVTATDTAVLSGVYPKVCYRKYYGYPLRTSYSEEMGIRLLISSIALVASRLDLSIIPIFSHGYRNYLRVYCKVSKSNYLANKIHEKLGYVVHCFNCRHRYFIKNLYGVSDCNKCHKRVTIGGPLWTSQIFDKDLIIKIVHSIAEDGNCPTEPKESNPNPLLDFFSVALNELDAIPYYYVNDEVGKVLKKNVMNVKKIIELLKTNGYQSSKTIFAPNGFKTNASITEIKKLLI
ncbi:MAG: tRNA (guanine(10)-N(2))-dimethyltransferase [Nitrosopumilus sp.]|nr:tRNA (guanine(10)-N(2))-dimethyltransferase [Nitrosopumilus sp.]